MEILEREKLLQQRLRLRSTFAVTGDGETREATFWFFLKEIWILVLFGSIIYHAPSCLVRPLAGLTKAPSTLIRFQTKTELFCSVSKRFASTLIVFVSFSPVHTTTPYLFENAVMPSVRMVKCTRRKHISIYRPANLKVHGSACPPFWILTVEWFDAWS